MRVSPDACNLWIIDEGLAFHNYLASDKSIRAIPFTDATDRLEPDLLALMVEDQPMTAEGPLLVAEVPTSPGDNGFVRSAGV